MCTCKATKCANKRCGCVKGGKGCAASCDCDNCANPHGKKPEPAGGASASASASASAIPCASSDKSDDPVSASASASVITKPKFKFKVTTLNADRTAYHRCNRTHELHLARLFASVRVAPGFILCVQEIGTTVNACNRLTAAVRTAFGGEIGSCFLAVDVGDHCHILWDAGVWTRVGEQRVFDLEQDEDPDAALRVLRRGGRNNRADDPQDQHDHTRPRIQHITLDSESVSLDVINVHLYHRRRTDAEKQQGITRLANYARLRAQGELVVTGDFNLGNPVMPGLECATPAENVMNTFYRDTDAIDVRRSRYVIPECTRDDCVDRARPRLLGHPVLEMEMRY